MTTLNGSHNGHDILLLAERLRVEERLLMAAFSSADHSARIVTPAEMSLTIGRRSLAGKTVVSRLPASREGTTLALLLDDAGATVINNPSLAALLEDRARLLHWLSVNGFETLPATVGFSEEQILGAADAVGYPAVLSALDAGQPSITVQDREVAEAVIEHRAVLGKERALIVRRAVVGATLRRIVVAGDATFAAVASGNWPIADDTSWQPDAVTAEDLRLADDLRLKLGVGLYHADCVAGAPPTVLKVRPLSVFRAFHDAGHDVAGAIVQHTLNVGLEAAHV
jgi:[lysine-biosynthesis-protein LysW]--L-2-aminoadipate ligase